MKQYPGLKRLKESIQVTRYKKGISEYRVIWEIDIEADNLKEAVREALRIQRDPESTATIFKVTDKEIRKEYMIDGVGLK